MVDSLSQQALTRRINRLSGWMVLCAFLVLGVAQRVAAVDGDESSGAPHNRVAHEHAAHAHAGRPAGYSRRVDNYTPPTVQLRDSVGTDVVLSDLLAEDRPVLMQFIFTSCATICPLLSATFSKGQGELATVRDGYRMISISIDPEYDTPKRLAVYAKRNNAGDNWMFLTGSKGDIGKVMRSFDVLYQGDNKMYHQPYTFLRARPSAPWVRIDGFMTVRELVQEYRAALSSIDVALH